jgi:spore maturation protein CgeB
MRNSSLNTLVLYARYTDKLSYYDDWQHAFETHPDLRARSVNICEGKNLRSVKRSIGEYDLIVLLHSVNADTLVFIEPYRSILKDRKGKLLSFVGNEVNLPRISMKVKIDFIKDVSAEFIGTQLPLEAGRWLYAECKDSSVVALPHALNPGAFRPFIPCSDRTIDIGARSHQYWSCLGDNERNDLYGFFARHPFNPPLKLDIDTKSRFDRSGWSVFLNQCKGTISNEAGSYYLERDDATVRKIQAFVESQQKKKGSKIVKPDSLPERLWRFVPKHLKEVVKAPLSRFLKSLNVSYYSDIYEQLDFNETFEKFFKDTPLCPIHSKAISSRHFDAVGTKTCQIMLEGRYNDILKADAHFIALKHDFSNIAEVMARFHDSTYRQVMVDRAYEYIMDQHTYRHRIDTVRDLM